MNNETTMEYPSAAAATASATGESKPAETVKLPEVWVFGAGIAGLTAAHELAERGFEVHVVEPALDVMSSTPEFSPAVGGLARTQWAQADAGDPIFHAGYRGTNQKLSRADPWLPLRRIHFSNGEIDSGDKVLLDLVAKALITYDVPPPIRLVGTGLTRQEGEDKASKVSAYVVEKASGAKFLVEGRVSNVPGVDEVEMILEDRYKLAGEHGFRFFPAFYQHVFDTMKRIPDPTAKEGIEDAYRTVYDNLIPTEKSLLAMEKKDALPLRSVEFSRRRPVAVRTLVDALQSYLRELEYTSEDIARLSIKIFKYMTSCSKRRATEYEDISWWDFIDGDQFSAVCRDHLDKAPELLGAMVAKKSDARTQGNCVVQLLLDPILRPDRVDSTLNAPTSAAWFEPWRKYLSEVQDVDFKVGRLVDFKFVEGQGIVPIVVGWDEQSPVPIAPGSYFVLAASLPAMLRGPDGSLGLADRFVNSCPKRADQGEERPKDPLLEIGDFVALARQASRIEDWNSVDHMPDNPLQHLTGIQFFFPTDALAQKGHTLYLDSPWRLSSISSVSFWHRRRERRDGYRGILSVDVGNVYTKSDEGLSFWQSTRTQIAEGVWAQVRATTPDSQSVAEPVGYHIDENIVFGAEGTPLRNEAPYLVNRPADWALRPGEPGEYKVQYGRWVLAGTFMKTHTRLTTMEAANESGRHAVNALLAHLEERDPLRRWTRCWTTNPEEHELPDLEWLRELDLELFNHGRVEGGEEGEDAEGDRQRLPHFIDILGLEEIPETILEGGSAGLKRALLRYFAGPKSY